MNFIKKYLPFLNKAKVYKGININFENMNNMEKITLGYKLNKFYHLFEIVYKLTKDYYLLDKEIKVSCTKRSPDDFTSSGYTYMISFYLSDVPLILDEDGYVSIDNGFLPTDIYKEMRGFIRNKIKDCIPNITNIETSGFYGSISTSIFIEY